MTDGKDQNRGWFRKGQSGNPGGRPKRSQKPPAASAFDIIVDRMLSITRGGKLREVSMEEALQHRTYQDAIAGKRLAMREVMRWIEQREQWLAKHSPASRPSIRYHDAVQEPDNADEAMVLLGIADHNPKRAGLAADRAQLLLEPWAVEIALRRRRGASPSRSDLDEMRRCTRAPETIRWPEAGHE